MNYIKYFLLVILLIYSGNAKAQTEKKENSFQKYNWFVNGSVNGEWLSHTNGNMFAGGKLGGGIYLTKYSGIRINLLAGKSLIVNQKIMQLGWEADYLFNIVGNRGYQPFNLSIIIGGTYNYFDTQKIENAYDKVSTIGAKAGLQASFQINRKMSLFIEPTIGLQPKNFYIGEEKEVYLLGNLSIGFAYCFKDKYKGTSQKNKKNTTNIKAEDIQEIKTKMNLLLEEIDHLKEEVKGARKPAQGQEIVMEPQAKEALSVDIVFEPFSSFISSEQSEKIKNVGKWLQEHPACIKMISFSDKMKNKNAEESLKEQRLKAIRDVLINEYNIVPERIIIASPESMGYENKTGSNVTIVYIPSK